MFPRLQYLSLQFNNLGFYETFLTIGSGNFKTAGFIPSALPQNWTEPTKRVFPALSVLTLYPGNDYLCSIPKVEDDPATDTSALAFQDPNLGEPPRPTPCLTTSRCTLVLLYACMRARLALPGLRSLLYQVQ